MLLYILHDYLGRIKGRRTRTDYKGDTICFRVCNNITYVYYIYLLKKLFITICTEMKILMKRQLPLNRIQKIQKSFLKLALMNITFKATMMKVKEINDTD